MSRLAPARKPEYDAAVWIATPNAASLHEIGRWVGQRVFVGAVVLLEGPLGAGKTTFAQGARRRTWSGRERTQPNLCPRARVR